jgi:hypothetical protein
MGSAIWAYLDKDTRAQAALLHGLPQLIRSLKNEKNPDPVLWWLQPGGGGLVAERKLAVGEDVD